MALDNSNEQGGQPHDDAANSHPGTQSLTCCSRHLLRCVETRHDVCVKGVQGITYSCCLPEESSEACAIIKEAGKFAFDVSTSADGEDDHGEKRLEVEEGRHSHEELILL